ncbi:MAG: type III secretion protein [Desulfovibrionaceae bacterium]|nr:type III secretion protein [Desulfovibrionaceae bacterium]
MADPIRLLDANLGISGILDAQENAHIPQARPLPSTALREAGLEELFGAKTSDKYLEEALCPDVGDGTILEPATFSAAIKSSLETLKDQTHADIRSFISGELAPLTENDTLLQAYSGLLVGG